MGLGALLALSQLAYDALRVLGTGYLVFLGARMVSRGGPSESAVPVNRRGAWRSTERAPRWFVRGLLTNLLNPKVGVFYVTFLPQFVPTGVSVTPFSMLLAAIHATEGMLWFAALTLATRSFARWLRNPRVARTLDRVTGAVLIGFGLDLVLAKRR